MYLISETTRDTKERNLTELQNNIYMLFDYQIHQYWCDNYFQPEFSVNPCDKSLFGKGNNMRLVVNAHDDWQLKFSDKFKRIINQFLKDNLKLHQRGHEKIKYKETGKFRCYQDVKEYSGDQLVYQLQSSDQIYTSVD